MFTKIFQFHWRRRNPRAFAIWTAWCCWSLFNRMLMRIEDWVFPGLTDLEQQIGKPSFRSIMVMGHPRSATTNVHENLVAQPHTFCSTNLDFVFPSLLLKLIACPVIGLVDKWFLRRFETAEHAFNVRSGLEEQLWLLHLGCSEEIIDVFPEVLDQPEIFREAISYSPRKAQFIKQCIARVIYKRGIKHGFDDQSVYVGHPLLFSIWNEEFLEEFPGANVVICNRDPHQSIGSYANLLVALTGKNFDETFRRQYENVYKYYCVPIYKNLQQMVIELPRNRWQVVNFEDWKLHPMEQLKRILEFNGMRASDSFCVLDKSEQHTNDERAYELIQSEDIQRDVWPQFRFLETAERESFEPQAAFYQRFE